MSLVSYDLGCFRTGLQEATGLPLIQFVAILVEEDGGDRLISMTNVACALYCMLRGKYGSNGMNGSSRALVARLVLFVNRLIAS